jgi:predicted kinase
MSKLKIIRGLPGSGKSTLARMLLKSLLDKGEKSFIVCRDDLRAMGGFPKAPGIYEDMVTLQANALIRQGLKVGATVIVADCNLNAKYVKAFDKIAEFFGAEVEVIDLDVPLETCIERDANRPDSVGADVIRKMHRRYFRKGQFPPNPLTTTRDPVTLVPYQADVGLPPAFIFDIDGTVAKMNGRSPYDYSRVSEDLPHTDIVQLIEHIHALGYKIIFLSGREDWCKYVTADWLAKHINIDMSDVPLHMRKTEDGRADFIIKHEIFWDKIAPYFNVVGVFDDRDQVVAMWRDIDVRCYQVAPGPF